MACFDLCGYRISANGAQADIDLAWNMVKSGKSGGVIACANPHSLVVARKDDHFRYALQQADLLLPDGVGIVMAARILGNPLSERVAGFEFFSGLSQKGQQGSGLRYFFLGSSQDVLARIVERMGKEYPNIEVCGVLSPPFKTEFSREENQRMVNTVNEAQPDVLWVGMTAPKQEKWIEEHRRELQVPLSCAVGAVFDFYAGTRKRAPQWVCRMGLEWLPRLLREPKRLFRRNFISSPLFLSMVFGEKLRAIMARK